MLVTFLGTGDSNPSLTRSAACYLVETDGAMLLVDCGEGAPNQLLRSFADFDAVDAVFLTHRHYDHVSGLPGLVNAWNLRKRARPLNVYGPQETLAVAAKLLELFDADFPVELHAAAGEVSIGPLVVTAVPLFSEPLEAVAWLVTHAERKVLFSGDTGPNENLAAAAHNVDLLVHEATFPAAEEELAGKIMHSTSAQAAQIAQEAAVGLLALTHIPDRYSDEELLGEAEAVFAATFLACDFDQVLLAETVELTRAGRG
jgi:ribonuclease Z